MAAPKFTLKLTLKTKRKKDRKQNKTLKQERKKDRGSGCSRKQGKAISQLQNKNLKCLSSNLHTFEEQN